MGLPDLAHTARPVLSPPRPRQARQSLTQMDRPSMGRRQAGWDAAVVASVIVLWLLPWSLITAATLLAGGEPTAGPVAFITPSHVVAAVHRMHGVAPWLLVSSQRPVSTVLFWGWLGLSVAVLAMAAGLTRRAVLCRVRRPASLQRASRWAGRRDMASLRSRRAQAGRFIAGCGNRRLVLAEPESSVLVIGPTRSGKTSSVLIPNLLEWRGPAVVTSTKGELVRLTAGHRQRIGPVFVYDPTGDAGGAVDGVSWSPIAGCHDLDHAWRVAAWLCAGLQQGGGRGDNDWTHWSESGKLLIAPLLFAAACSDRTIVDVQSWIHAFDAASPMGVLEDLLDGGNQDAGRALSMLQSVEQRPEKERGTVFSTVMRIFSAFNERAVARSAQSSRFDADRLLQQRGTLYLCSARQSPERVAGLFVGLLMTVVTAAYDRAESSAGGRLEPALGLFLDELANVVPIEDLPSLASQGAGRGLLLMSVVQDISQLRARYGPDRTNSIVNNHVCKLVLPGLADIESTDVIARLAGQGRRTEVQLSRSADRPDAATYALRDAPLATPDGLRQLRAGQAVMLHRGLPPAVIALRPWYRDRRLRALCAEAYLRSVDYCHVPSTRRRKRIGSLSA